MRFSAHCLHRFFIFLMLTASVLTGLSSCASSSGLKFTKEVYIFGLPSKWQYVSLYDVDRNLSGFLSDFALDMGHELGFSVKIVSVDPDEAPVLLENGHIDACFSALPKTPAALKRYLFSDPIFVSGTVVVVSKTTPFRTLADMHSKEIAFDNSQNATITMGADPSWILRPYSTVLRALEDADKGVIDGVLLNYMQARLLTKSLFSFQYRIILPPIASEDIKIIVPQGGAKELVQAVNGFLERSKKSGEYNDLLRYWNVDASLDEKEPKG